MAEALIGGLLAAGAATAEFFWATDPSAARRAHLDQRFGIRVTEVNREAAAWADLVLLAVKPQVLDDVLDELSPVVAGKLIVSLAAGVPIRRLAARLPADVRLVRVMPNAAVLVREGMSAMACGERVTQVDEDRVTALLRAVGRVTRVDESQMDAVTGLSGSGPAYVFLALEALADGGVKAGLPRATAEVLAAQTAYGAARMVLETGEHPGRLKDRVASPGGTTIAGLHVLEQGGLRATLIGAVAAATQRSQEMGRSCLS